jgi:outer membrane protein assembly factor BamB
MKRLFWIIVALFVILTVPTLPCQARAATAAYFDTVQKLYIGYYQRPADPEGLLFWANGLAAIDINGDGNFAGENFEPVLEQFSRSEEARVIYGGDVSSSNIAKVVDSIYMGLFNRYVEPGASGLDFWVNGFNSGGATPANILWQVITGAQGPDAASVRNKLTAANRFTQTLDPELDGEGPFQATWFGAEKSHLVRQWLAAVGSDDATIPTQNETTAFMKGYIADAGDPLYSFIGGATLHSFSQGSVGFYYNSPTIVGDYLYIGTSRGFNYDVAGDNSFFKLDLSLNKVWEYPLAKREVRGAATLDGAGNIYFVVEEGRLREDTSNSRLYLYSLDNNGNFRWSRQTATSVPILGMSNPAIATDGTVYVGGDKFSALDTNGNVLWEYEWPGNAMDIMNAPIVDPDGNVYFVATWGYVVSLTPKGTVRWEVATLNGEHYSSPAFSTDYSRVFVAVQNTVYCLESTTGNRVWQFTPPGIIGSFRATPAVDNNNNIYLGTKADSNSVFYGIKSDGSALLWENKIGADLYSSPALGNDNTIYVGSEYAGGKRLHALHMSTGNTRWSASLSAADLVWSSSAILNTGILYIGSMDYLGTGGGVYAVQTDSTSLLENAGSARFHEGNASTGRRE